MLAALEPVRVNLWRVVNQSPEDEAAERLRQATAEAVDLVFKAWTRNLPHCEIDTYEPLNVSRYLHNWEELESAANGVGSSGVEIVTTSGKVDSRRTLIAVKADLEQGTDHGLWSILNWRAAERIYRRQNRMPRYRQRYATFMATWREQLRPEPMDKALAESVCIERISRALGWYPHAVCVEK